MQVSHSKSTTRTTSVKKSWSLICTDDCTLQEGKHKNKLNVHVYSCHTVQRKHWNKTDSSTQRLWSNDKKQLQALKIAEGSYPYPLRNNATSERHRGAKVTHTTKENCTPPKTIRRNRLWGNSGDYIHIRSHARWHFRWHFRWRVRRRYGTYLPPQLWLASLFGAARCRWFSAHPCRCPDSP